MPGITSRERSDPAAAAEIFRKVFAGAPDPARQSYIDFLVGDVQHLALQHNDRWGITLLDWGVRLNVGWVECLVLHSGGLRILVDKDVAPADTRFDGVSYKRAPGCDMTTIPLPELPKVLPSLEGPHYAALASAANWPSPPNIRGAHSAGVTDLLSLPNPTYYVALAQEGRDEETTPAVFIEGRRIAVLVNRFERDASARQACIRHHGLRCSVCGMSFGDRYGETMKDLIHVHHVVPLSAIGVKYQIDPIKDLRPVCPNCHAVLHRDVSPMGIEQARALLSPSKL